MIKQIIELFQAPVAISPALAKFLEVEPDTKLRRPDVTSLISKYADKHGLKKATDKTIFLPDDKMKKLFGPAIHFLRKGSEVKGYGMFNLQTYLKPHYVKAEPEAVVA